MNEIVFPAGIMQPPLYDPLADDAVNYGALALSSDYDVSRLYDRGTFRRKGNLRLVDSRRLQEFQVQDGLCGQSV